MQIHLLPLDEALRTLRTTQAGLSADEVERRLREYGRNAVERVRRTPAWLRFARELGHFLALVLWVAAALCLVAEAVSPGEGMLTLGVAIVVVILVNAGFSFWQETRAERVFAALEKLLPHSARVRREGAVAVVPVEELVPGDVVLLQAGDEIPADCRVIESSALRVNTAVVTGESQPRARDMHAPGAGQDALHARNVVLAGTTIVSGTAAAVVTATGSRTELGRIAQLAQRGAPPPSPLVREISRLSRWIAVLAVLLGVSFSAAGVALGMPLWSSLIFGIGIIAANVPEGLLPTVTLSLAMAGQRMARRNVVVRRLPAVEALGAATVIVTDKTGTLTEGKMVARLAWLDGAARELSELDGLADARELLWCARLCQDAVQGRDGQMLGDPVDLALRDLAHGARGCDSWPRLASLPFDADRRRMSVAHQEPGAAARAFAKGAPESLLPCCTQVQRGGAAAPLDEPTRQQILAAAAELAGQGLRVLALAGRTLPGPPAEDDPALELELTFLGLVGLEDPPRAEVPAAVRAARAAGLRVVMATGDHPVTALAIARRVGLVSGDDAVVRTGPELRDLSDTQLQLLLDTPELVFARVSAEQKLRVVQALQRKGHVVAVTGDGVNDAPALQAADIGVAMGRSGSDVAREAADLVLVDDNFAAIVAAVEEGRAVWDNLKKFMTYILASNVPEIVPYLAFVLLRVPLALTIVQVLAVDLGTDMVPALALGADRADPDVMLRPPRARSERLLDGRTLLRAYAWLGMIEAAAAMIVFFLVLRRGGWSGGAPDAALYRVATTATLAAIVAAQLGNVLVCRSDRAALWSRPLRDNRLLWWGMAVELLVLAAIVWTPVGQALFGTAPLPAQVLLWLVPVPLVLVALEETRKALLRRRDAARRTPRAPAPDRAVTPR